MQTFFTALGLLGAALQVTMYACLQMKKVDGEALMFYALNGTGSILVGASLIAGYSQECLGAIILETIWLLISVAGVVRHLRPPPTTA